MTTLENAARQALEALEEYQSKGAPFMSCDAAVEALRKALEQPKQEPVLKDIEQYRMQMAGICTAAIGYWKEADSIHPDYDTVALRDVAKLYAEYDALYKAQQEQEPYCWKVLGVASEFTGYYAEEEAKATAKRIGGTCQSFPLYVRPQPLAVERERNFCERCGKREWVGLTDGEIQQGNTESWVTQQAWQSAVWWADERLKEKNT